VQFTQRSVTKAASGEPIESFTAVGNFYVEMRPRTAREVNGIVMVEQNTWDVYVRIDDILATLTAADQMKFRGQVYELTGTPMNIDGRDRELQIPVKLVTPSGVGNG
jgi:head-tail adaptor